MSNPIADMLTRIRNAQAVKHPTVRIPYSKFKFNLAKLLEREGWIGEVSVQGRKVRKSILINLKYDEKGEPIIHELKQISRPGQRIYLGKKEIKPVKQGYGIGIISTPKGLLTDKEARQKGVGGEMICEVW